MKRKTENDSNQNMKEYSSKLMSKDIRFLVYGPVILSLGILVLITLIMKFIVKSTIPFRISGFIIGVSVFIAGLGGIPQIIRKEMPGIMWGSKVEGVVPVISGIIQLSLFSGGGLMVIIATYFENYVK